MITNRTTAVLCAAFVSLAASAPNAAIPTDTSVAGMAGVPMQILNLDGLDPANFPLEEARRGRGKDDGPGHIRGGGDDGTQHARRGRGADDGPGHSRRGRGQDDGPGHIRHGHGADDPVGHT